MATRSHVRQGLVIGGGIAGPATAIALQRAGMTATVFEASDEPRDQAGAFLNLAPNGMRALDAIGLAPVLDGLGFVNDRLIFSNEAGRRLAEVPVGGITVLRGSLSRALREAALSRGIPIVFGKTLTAVTQQADAVVAHFADGTSVSGEVLIGADGIGSRVRASVFPEAPAPAYTGTLNLGGVVHTTLPSTGNAMHMIFGRRAFFGYAVRPSGETYWFSNVPESDPLRASELARSDASRLRERLDEVHRDDPAEVRQILDALPDRMGAYLISDLRSVPAWHRARVGLLGDAAHAIGPHVGQGASLALEDAVVIAQCLRDVLGVPQALATFERIRRPRIQPVIAQSLRTARQKAPAGWVGRRLRDLILPVFLRKGAEAAQELYKYALVWGDMIPGTERGIRL